jgi:hypothetical protein
MNPVVAEPLAPHRASQLDTIAVACASESFLWNFSWEALEQAVNPKPAPEDVYCRLSVTLMEACAPVLTSDAVTTTV